MISLTTLKGTSGGETSKVVNYLPQGIERVPDGSVLFRESSHNSVNMRLQINDMYLSEYHANNGLTKSTLKLGELLSGKTNGMSSARKNLKNQNATWPVDIVFD